MTTLTKGAAYARALARELRVGRNLLRMAPRLGLEIREVNADGFDGALIRARELPLGAIVIRRSIREAGRKNLLWLTKSAISFFRATTKRNSSAPSRISEIGAMDREKSNARRMNLPRSS